MHDLGLLCLPQGIEQSHLLCMDEICIFLSLTSLATEWVTQGAFGLKS